MQKGLPGSDRFHQGYYKLQNVEKYLGNPVEVRYLSSWEYKFMLYCDLNPGVLKWGSEIFKIPYIDRMGHNHYYMPDFYLETRNSDNPDLMNRYLVEIKPEKEIREPTMPVGNLSEKKLKRLEYEIATWQKNKYKWTYTIEWCKARDMKFWLVTETHLNKLKP
jgi:Straboviridae/Kyanoviridae head completion nuclease